MPHDSVTMCAIFPGACVPVPPAAIQRGLRLKADGGPGETQHTQNPGLNFPLCLSASLFLYIFHSEMALGG